MARPSKYDPEAVAQWVKENTPENPTEALLEARKLGLTREHAAAVAGISVVSMLEWEETNPEFLNAVKKAEALGAEELFKLVRSEPQGWQRMAWILERSFGYKADAVIDQTINVTIPADMMPQATDNE